MTFVLAMLTALFLTLAPAGASAQAAAAAGHGTAGVVRDGPVEARLVAEQVSVAPGRPFTVALMLSMDPDWHVYWKYPGDSGLPTTLTWGLPAGFRAGPVRFPVPERFVTGGLVTYGYPGRVLLLAEITPTASLRPGQRVQVTARADWLACRVECVPGKAVLSLSLPVTAGQPSRNASWAAAFDETRSRLPSAPAAGMSLSAVGEERSITLVASRSGFPVGVTALFYPAADGINVSAPQEAIWTGDTLRLKLQRQTGVKPPGRLTGLLVTSGPGESRAADVDVAVATQMPASAVAQVPPSAAALPPQARPGIGLVAAILLAFIGGMILNLMPCVLPVISLKALSLMRQGEGRGARHGLLYSLGVLASFWAVAGVLESLRAGGRLLGWGFQFQDPVVVLVTAMLFFLIGLNLFGVFEVGSAITRLGGRLAGGRTTGRSGGGTNATSGGGTNARSGGGSAFATGIFATAVATPCTAPFMGAAVGYALSHSVAASFGVFTALGAGMAAPVLALAVVPGLARRLPRPGAWMETFRQVMAFPMMAAAVWMTSVLSSLSGSQGAVLLLAAMLAAGLGAWIWGRWGTLSRATGARVAAGVLAVVLVVGATAAAARLLPAAATAAEAQNASDPAGGWSPWSEARLAALRGAGTPVFVDFTAKWCLTCAVNEKVALSASAVRARFAEAGVATLRADWTESNDEIARALASFGRAGVPLYVYYPRGGKDPVVLPEVLTPGIVLAALADR